MKDIRAYLECDGGAAPACAATPANTMGMGNPGETGPDTLTEPIGKAYSEVEKDKKKKKKKKVKSLAESLFDKDLTKQGAHIGDIYELDEWTIPARGEEYSFTDDIINWGIKNEIGVVLGKSHWRKILKPLKTFPPVSSMQCRGSYFFKYVTELILCCESVEQIPDVVRDYIMDCKNDPSKYINFRDREFVERHLFKDVVVQTLDMRDQPLRMVAIKFIMEDGKDYIVCVTFKKREA